MIDRFTAARRVLRFIATASALVSLLAPGSVRAQLTLPKPPPIFPGAPGSTVAPTPPGVQKVTDQWHNAVRLQKANKLPEAINAYNTFIKSLKAYNLAPEAAIPAYQNLAVIYRGQGDANDLIGALRNWSALEPKNGQVHAELAALFASPSIQRFDVAATEARQALALKPSAAIAAAAHATLGMAAIARKNFPAAEQEFSAAGKLNPKNVQMSYNYGLALVQEKKFAQALAVMKHTTVLDPKMAGAWYYVGLLNETQQKYPESIAAFHQAVHLAPTDPTIHFDLARVQLRTNDVDGAITSYLVVLEFAPQSIPARTAVAHLYAQLHNYTAAKIHFGEAVRLSPKNPELLAGLGEAELQLSFQPQDAAARAAMLKRAEEHYAAAAAIDPKYAVGTQSLAHVYERSGAYAKAQEIYRKRLESDPKSFANANALANTFMMQRKADEAIAIWRKFRDANPGSTAATMRIAETLESLAKWKDAIAEWRLLIVPGAAGSTSAAAMVAIGKDLAHDQRPKEAVDQFTAVLKLDATAASAPAATRLSESSTIRAERLEALHQLSEIAEQANKPDEAIQWLQQVKAEEAAQAEKMHAAPNPATYLALSRVYQRAKKPDLAVKELDSLTQVRMVKRQDLATAYEELAQVYETQSKFDEAIGAYRRAAQYSKDPLSSRLRIADDYERSKRLPLAIAELESAKKDLPKEPRVLAPLAMVYRQASRDEDALRIYDQLLLADPRATWARDQKAVVYTHMKRYDDARALYETQLATNPQNRQLYADISYVFQSEGKPDAFLDWALPRLAKSPANPTLMAVVLDETTRQKKPEAGWNILRESAAKHKSDRAVLETTATLMTQRGHEEDAIGLYRQIASLNPKDLTAQVTLADQLYSRGHKDEATKLYSDLIARPDLGASEKLAVRRQYASCCLANGDSAQAIIQLQTIVKADPNDFDSATRLALQLEAAGRQTEAVPLLESLATKEAYGANVRAQIRTKLGGIYLKSGDKVKAAAEYRQAVALNPNDTEAQAALAQLK